MKVEKIAVILSCLSPFQGHEGVGRVGLCHHRELQETVCFIHTNWDPPIDSRCTKEGENSSGIPVFLCCGPS